jgi:hypothetical protein
MDLIDVENISKDNDGIQKFKKMLIFMVVDILCLFSIFKNKRNIESNKKLKIFAIKM